MRARRRGVSAFGLLAALAACDGDGKADFAKADESWMSSIGKVELAVSEDSQKIGTGDCRTGTVAALHVDLCLYKDALSADAARNEGLERIGSATGVALVRGSTLLVVTDPGLVDPHGKLINRLSKTFLEPKSAK